MGIEKDYIIRQLMMLFEALQKIMKLRKMERKDEAIEEIHSFYAVLKIDEEIETMEIEDLISFLEKEKNLTREQIEMVGYVLKERGEIEDNPVSKTNFLSKSFFILQKVDRESITFSMDRQMKLAELKEMLKKQKIPYKK